MALQRINIGCGQTPTAGWRNIDNSLSLKLSKIPLLPFLLLRIGFISAQQHSFIKYARKHAIEYGDATKGLCLQSNSTEVVYSSHMLEHLDQVEAVQFLKEVQRILAHDGIIRLVVPDLRLLVQNYLETKDADRFLKSTHLAQKRPRSLSQWLGMIVIGNREHHWMYDGLSLSELLKSQGFANPVILEAGKTTIVDSRDLNLYERSAESVYVEAVKI